MDPKRKGEWTITVNSLVQASIAKPGMRHAAQDHEHTVHMSPLGERGAQ